MGALGVGGGRSASDPGLEIRLLVQEYICANVMLHSDIRTRKHISKELTRTPPQILVVS